MLHQEEVGQPAWFLAAKSDNLKLLKEFWTFAKEKGNPEERKYNLLLSENKHGEMALHVTTERNVALLETLWAFFLKNPNVTRTS